MARSHAKVLVSIWRDDDWIGQTIDVQWLYWLILSQPKLTLVGSIELAEARWSTFGADATRERIDAALHALRASGKVIVDDETGELLVRRFTAHDLDAGRLNQNLAKGLWGHWGGIASRALRSEAVLLMPEDVWEKVEPHAPYDAKEIRKWGRFEPDDRTGRSNAQIEPPSSTHLPPAATRPPAEPVPHTSSVDNLLPLRDRLRAVHEKFTTEETA